MYEMMEAVDGVPLSFCFFVGALVVDLMRWKTAKVGKAASYAVHVTQYRDV